MAAALPSRGARGVPEDNCVGSFDREDTVPDKLNKSTPSTSAAPSEHAESAPTSPSSGGCADCAAPEAMLSTVDVLHITDIEPYTVARFLTFGEVARLALAGREVEGLLTAPGPAGCRQKLIVPVVEVKLHNMDILKRASAKHIEVLRVWSRGAFEEVKRVIDEEGKDAFAALERFSAKACSVNAWDAGALAPLIGGSRKLSLVNFEKNQFSDMVVTPALARAFAESTFDTLNLRFNLVSDATATAVAEVLRQQHRTLSVVNFKMNRITDIGAVQLASALHRNTVLRVLNLRRQHPGLTDKSANAFALALDENRSLVKLRLRRNYITDEGCTSLADAIAQRYERLAQSVGENAPSFELDLEDNKVGVHGATAIVRCLRRLGPDADLLFLLHGNPDVDRYALRRALIDAGEDPCGADDNRLWIETSKAEHLA